MKSSLPSYKNIAALQSGNFAAFLTQVRWQFVLYATSGCAHPNLLLLWRRLYVQSKQLYLDEATPIYAKAQSNLDLLFGYTNTCALLAVCVIVSPARCSATYSLACP